MADLAVGEIEVPASGILKRHIAAWVVGNALEFYDFTTYSFFGVQIGHALFPGKDPFANLMLSLAASVSASSAGPSHMQVPALNRQCNNA